MKLRSAAWALSTIVALAACGADDTAIDAGTSNVTAKTGGQVELFRSAKDGQFYFRLKAKNGEIILQSEGYKARASAERAILSVEHSGQHFGAFELLPASSNPEGRSRGQWYFNLLAPNGQVIGTSEIYSSKSSAKRGRSTVMGYAAGDPRIDDWADQCGADLFRGNDDQLYFSLRAANGQRVLASEGYSSEAAAKNGIASVLENGLEQARFELKESSDGGFYFNLRAGNHQVVGTSEIYSSKSAAVAGMSVVQNLARAQAQCLAGFTDDGDSVTNLVCEGGWGHPLLGDISEDMESFISESLEVNFDNFQAVLEPGSLAERQIRWAANHNSGTDFDADMAEVMDTADEATFWIHQLEIGEARYTWVKYYGGENESGVVFAGGTDRAVVRISDEDLQNCDVAPQDVLQHGDECSAEDQCGEGLLCSGLTVGYAECRPASMSGTFSSSSTTLDVAGLTTVPEDVIVTLDIDHPSPEDLTVALHQPGGGYEVLWDRQADPPNKVSAGWGIERDNMVNGTWTLEITDHVSAGTSALNSWSMFVSSRWD